MAVELSRPKPIRSATSAASTVPKPPGVSGTAVSSSAIENAAKTSKNDKSPGYAPRPARATMSTPIGANCAPKLATVNWGQRVAIISAAWVWKVTNEPVMLGAGFLNFVKIAPTGLLTNAPMRRAPSSLRKMMMTKIRETITTTTPIIASTLYAVADSPLKFKSRSATAGVPKVNR